MCGYKDGQTVKRLRTSMLPNDHLSYTCVVRHHQVYNIFIKRTTKTTAELRVKKLHKKTCPNIFDDILYLKL